MPTLDIIWVQFADDTKRHQVALVGGVDATTLCGKPLVDAHVLTRYQEQATSVRGVCSACASAHLKRLTLAKVPTRHDLCAIIGDLSAMLALAETLTQATQSMSALYATSGMPTREGHLVDESTQVYLAALARAGKGLKASTLRARAALASQGESETMRATTQSKRASKRVGNVLSKRERARRAGVDVDEACSECFDWFDNPLNRGAVTATNPTCPISRETCVRFAKKAKTKRGTK